MLNGFYAPLVTATTDGAALASSTSATSILPAQAVYTLPHNFFSYVGQKIMVRASGRVSTLVTTPGTLSLDVRFGATTVFAGGAMTLNTTAQTNTHWWLIVELDLRVSGGSAQLFGAGSWRSHAVIGSPAPTAGGCGEHLLPYNAAPALGTAFNAATTQAVDLYATWSVSSASNSITLHRYELLSCL